MQFTRSITTKEKYTKGINDQIQKLIQRNKDKTELGKVEQKELAKFSHQLISSSKVTDCKKNLDQAFLEDSNFLQKINLISLLNEIALTSYSHQSQGSKKGSSTDALNNKKENMEEVFRVSFSHLISKVPIETIYNDFKKLEDTEENVQLLTNIMAKVLPYEFYTSSCSSRRAKKTDVFTEGYDLLVTLVSIIKIANNHKSDDIENIVKASLKKWIKIKKTSNIKQITINDQFIQSFMDAVVQKELVIRQNQQDDLQTDKEANTRLQGKITNLDADKVEAAKQDVEPANYAFQIDKGTNTKIQPQRITIEADKTRSEQNSQAELKQEPHKIVISVLQTSEARRLRKTTQAAVTLCIMFIIFTAITLALLSACYLASVIGASWASVPVITAVGAAATIGVFCLAVASGISSVVTACLIGSKFKSTENSPENEKLQKLKSHIDRRRNINTTVASTSSIVCLAAAVVSGLCIGGIITVSTFPIACLISVTLATAVAAALVSISSLCVKGEKSETVLSHNADKMLDAAPMLQTTIQPDSNYSEQYAQSLNKRTKSLPDLTKLNSQSAQSINRTNSLSV